MADGAGFGGRGRTVLASVAGLFGGIVVVAIVQGVGHGLFPAPPFPADPDPAALQAFLDAVPIGSKLFVVLAWTLGGFVAGLTGAVAAKGGWRAAGLAAGLGFALLTVFSLMALPHPLWMWIGGTLFPFPAAWLGRSLGGRDPAPPPAAPTGPTVVSDVGPTLADDETTSR